MTQQDDPYRHWDGHRWLRWDGAAWAPELAAGTSSDPHGHGDGATVPVSTSGEHRSNQRILVTTLPFALIATGGVSALVWDAQYPLALGIAAGLAAGAVMMELLWRVFLRARLVWTPGGLAYLTRIRSGTLSWDGLTIGHEGGGADLVKISGDAPRSLPGHTRRTIVMVASTGQFGGMQWLRAWTLSSDELIVAIEGARAGADPSVPPPPVPKATRPRWAWVAWLASSAVVLTVTWPLR